MTTEDAGRRAFRALAEIGAPVHEVLDRAMDECGRDRHDVVGAIMDEAVRHLWPMHPYYVKDQNPLLVSQALGDLKEARFTSARRLTTKWATADHYRHSEKWRVYAAELLRVCDLLEPLINLPG